MTQYQSSNCWVAGWGVLVTAFCLMLGQVGPALLALSSTAIFMTLLRKGPEDR